MEIFCVNLDTGKTNMSREFEIIFLLYHHVMELLL